MKNSTITLLFGFIVSMTLCGKAFAEEDFFYQSEQLCFEFQNSEWNEHQIHTLQCDEGRYIELEAVRVSNSCPVDCTTSKTVSYGNTLQSNLGTLEALCNARVTCNISASDITDLKLDDCDYVKLFIEYKCTTALQNICTQIETGQRLLMYSPNYPEGMNSSPLNCTCNITASSAIDLFVISIELDNSTSLTLTDTSQSEVTIANISHGIRSPKITLNLIRNSDNTYERFMIKFTSERPITINCLETDLERTTPNSVGSSTMTTVSSSFVPVQNQMDSSILAAIIVCILVLLFMIIIIIAVCIYWRKRKQRMDSKRETDTNYEDIHVNESDVNANNVDINGTIVGFTDTSGQENHLTLSTTSTVLTNDGFERDNINTDDYLVPCQRGSPQFVNAVEGNSLQVNTNEQGTVEGNSLQGNTHEQGTVEGNSLQGNTHEQGTVEGNSLQGNTHEQGTSALPHYANSSLNPPGQNQTINPESSNEYETLAPDYENALVVNQIPNTYEALGANHKSESTSTATKSGSKIPNMNDAQLYMNIKRDNIANNISDTPSLAKPVEFQIIQSVGKPGHDLYARVEAMTS